MRQTVLDKVNVDWVASTPVMDDIQAGALRRILNLSEQLSGDWSGMMGQSVTGEDFGALRFQLAYMSYALALTHAHRLPAAPGVFKTPMQRLIDKIRLPDCWIYWSNVSTGNGVLNKELGKLPQQWDPIAKENIMYSAYLQSMALMYHYLFRDARYKEPGSLTLRLQTKFWNEGGFTFPYDEGTINDLIFWQMAEEGFLGVACEPNCIFQICNQPSLIGFRMHDMVYGGDLAGEATAGYLRAWQEFGLVDENGNFNTLVQMNRRNVLTTDTPSMNFWLMTLMSSWNQDIVRQQYPVLMERHLLDGPDGTLWIKPKPGAGDASDTLLSAWDISWGLCIASEVGDIDTLERIFGYADRFMNPVWENGAYYHKRRDANFDDNGYFIGMDVASGNAMMNYARLNVPQGLQKLYEGPLTDRHFAQPALLGDAFRLDVRRAWFDPERNALAVTLGALRGTDPVTLRIGNAGDRPLPRVVRDGIEISGGIVRDGDDLLLALPEGGATTVVLQW